MTKMDMCRVRTYIHDMEYLTDLGPVQITNLDKFVRRWRAVDDRVGGVSR